jgi:hypothetical protein
VAGRLDAAWQLDGGGWWWWMVGVVMEMEMEMEMGGEHCDVMPCVAADCHVLQLIAVGGVV